MERPQRIPIDFAGKLCSTCRAFWVSQKEMNTHNSCCTDYDLWLKEKLDGLEGVIYKYLLNTEIGKQLNGKVDCADLASAIRKEFER